MKNHKVAIIFVTAYLIIFSVAGRLGTPLHVMFLLFSLSPILVLWMVYSILKYGKYTGKILAENEEWAYQDIDKDKLGTF